VSQEGGGRLPQAGAGGSPLAQRPDYTFAAGWLITLLQAEQVGLKEWSKSDFYGGVASFLRGAARARGFTPCNPDQGRVPGPAIWESCVSPPGNDNAPTDMVNKQAA
jgi:hypothetical protein